MHASTLSEPGAFRMVLAIALAVVVAVTAGVLIAPAMGVTVAIIAVIAGITFETHHLIA